jgi:hypothetical protein
VPMKGKIESEFRERHRGHAEASAASKSSCKRSRTSTARIRGGAECTAIEALTHAFPSKGPCPSDSRQASVPEFFFKAEEI